MSQAGSNGSGGGGAGGIVTIHGDSGSITGSSVTIYADNAALNCGSSVLFDNSGTVSTLNVTDSSLNTIIGQGSGSPNAGLADQTTILGALCLPLAGGGTGANVAIGVAVLNLATVAQSNVAIGNASLGNGTNLQFNCALGVGTLDDLQTGESNVAIGYSAGTSYTGSESKNILISHNGVLGDNSVTRIGTLAQQTECFVAGITGNTISSSPMMVTIDTSGTATDGQLGVAAIPGGASTSFSVVFTSPSSNFASGSGPNTLIYDTALYPSPDYSAGIYTVPVTGNYFLSCVFAANTSVSFTVCDLFLNKNSGTFILHLTPTPSTDGINLNNGSGSGIFPLVAGDTLQWQVFANTSGAADYFMSGNSNGIFNIFSGYKLP